MTSMTAAEFYEQRDGRTNLASPNSSYQRIPAALIVDPDWAATVPGQIAVLVSSNILARWCRTVTVAAPRTPLVGPLAGRGNDLLDLVLETMRQADPYGTFMAGYPPPERPSLFLGPEGPRNDRIFHAYGSDWQTTASTEPIDAMRTSDPRNPIGAIGAACFGTARLFMHIVGQEHGWSDPLFIDFFNMAGAPGDAMPFPSRASLGVAQLIGAGAVGSNLAYFLTLTTVVGRIAVVDLDAVKALNLNRSLLQTISDVGSNKADVTAEFLRRHRINAEAFPVSYDTFLDSGGDADWGFPDLIIPAANEQDVRWKLASRYPPLMIYGTTDNNWGAHLGRHIPFREECLACRFPREFQPAGLACSVGPLPDAEQNAPDAALPFLSSLAALLALAELAKAQLDGYPFHGGRAAIDIAGRPQQVAPAHAAPIAGCGACASRRRRVFSQLHGGRLWTSLSEP